MISELLVTSAPRGLQAGRSGFTTVYRTKGIHPDLASRLEAASGYRHVFPQGDPRNPIIFSYTSRPSTIGEVWVMSRIGDAGTDYSGRSNKIAHHIALQQDDIRALVESNPAELMRALAASQALMSRWEGEPRESPVPPRLPVLPKGPGVCQSWAVTGGDAGWAGFLVEKAINKESTWIIVPLGVDLLALFSEALALVSPDQRWRIPFTTYSLRGDEGRWLGAVTGSPEAASALAQNRIPVIDLTLRAAVPAGGAYVAAARGQGTVPWRRQPSLAQSGSATQYASAHRSSYPIITAAAPGGAQPTPVGPPTLARAPALGAPQPPEMTEWEEVPQPRRRIGRLVLAIIVSLFLVVFGAPLIAFCGYRLNLLPAEWTQAYEERAWRGEWPHKIIFKPAEPEALVAFKAVKNECDPILKKFSDESVRIDLEHHPFFKTLIEQEILPLKQKVDDLSSDQKLRERYESLPEITREIANARDNLKDLENTASYKEHRDIAAVLKKAKNAVEKEYENEQWRKIVDKRGDLERAASKREQNWAQKLQPLKKRLDEALVCTKRQEVARVESSGTTPARPDVGGLIVNAIEANRHLPIEGINSSSQEENGERVLAQWQDAADQQSLKTLRLSFPKIKWPDGQELRLSDAVEESKEKVKWRCVQGEKDHLIGEFVLTPTKLSFVFAQGHPGSAGKEILSLVPLHVSPRGGEKPKPIWLQLIKPKDNKPLSISRVEAPITLVSLNGNDGDAFLSDAIKENAFSLKLQNCVVVPESSVKIVLSRNGAEFSSKLLDVPLALSGETGFWWRLSGNNRGTEDDPCLYRERLVVNCKTEGKHGLALSGKSVFKLDMIVCDAAEKEKNRQLEKLIDNTVTGVKYTQFKNLIELLVTHDSGMLLPGNPRWQSFYPAQKKESIRELLEFDNQVKDKELIPFDKLLDEIRMGIAMSGKVKEIEERVMAELGKEPYDPPRPVPPKETADEKRNREKSEGEQREGHERRIRERVEKEYGSSDKLMLRLLESDQTSEEEIRLSGLFVWRSLFYFQELRGFEEFNKGGVLTSFKKLKEVAESAAVSVSGEVALEWKTEIADGVGLAWPVRLVQFGGSEESGAESGDASGSAGREGGN